jgi:hypothetical protein
MAYYITSWAGVRTDTSGRTATRAGRAGQVRKPLQFTLYILLSWFLKISLVNSLVLFPVAAAGVVPLAFKYSYVANTIPYVGDKG